MRMVSSAERLLANRVACWVGVSHTNRVAGTVVDSLNIVSAGCGWREVVVVLVMVLLSRVTVVESWSRLSCIVVGRHGWRKSE